MAEKIKQLRKKKGAALKYVIRFGTYGAGFIAVAVMLFIVLFIFVKGIPNINLELFNPNYSSENASLFPALINTISMIVLSLALAVPIGVFSAIYLVEYAKKGNRLVKVIRLTTETLSGIPSIVFGLFGNIVFVKLFGWGYSMLGGVFTLTIMILPTIIRSSEEALLAVSDTLREGSFGLGAGKLRTVFKISLPSATNGIFSAIVLSVGRIIGETAALIFTAGTVAEIPPNVFGSGRTLAVHMYVLWNEGFGEGASYATAVILILVVFGLNALSSFLAKKVNRA